MRILILEDNKGQQLVYRHWFEEDQIDLCESVEKAKKLWLSRKYDAAILDLYMGEDAKSGFHLLEEMIKEKDEKTKIIVVSAYTDELIDKIPPQLKDVTWISKEEATLERLKEIIRRRPSNSATRLHVGRSTF